SVSSASWTESAASVVGSWITGAFTSSKSGKTCFGGRECRKTKGTAAPSRISAPAVKTSQPNFRLGHFAIVLRPRTHSEPDRKRDDGLCLFISQPPRVGPHAPRYRVGVIVGPGMQRM